MGWTSRYSAPFRATALTAVTVALLVATSARGDGGACALLLVTDSLPGGRVLPKLLVLNAGERFAADGEILVWFRAAGAGAPDGPPQARVPVACSGWQGDHAEVIPLDPIELGGDLPAAVDMFGALPGQPPIELGRLSRDGDAVTLVRPSPAKDGEADTVALGVVDILEGGLFEVRVAFLNCGQAFDRDLWAFLHFEPEQTGEHLDATIALGLPPSATPVPSASWGPDTVAVVKFGPYEAPRSLDQPVYLRAGLYDHDGDGARVCPAGSGEDTRALIGRIVADGDGVRFERLLPWLGEEAGR